MSLQDTMIMEMLEDNMKKTFPKQIIYSTHFKITATVCVNVKRPSHWPEFQGSLELKSTKINH